MKMLIALISLIPLLVSANANPKIFRGLGENHQAKIVIAPFDDNDHYLIRFSGLENNLNNRTILHKKVLTKKLSHAGEYYFEQVGNLPRVNIRNRGKQTLIYGTSVPYIEIFTKQSAIPMVFNEHGKLSDQIKIQQAYVEDQGLVESLVKSKAVANSALDSFNKSCNQTTQLQINWDEFKKANQKTTPSMLTRYFDSLMKLCNKDQDYREAVAEIKNIVVQPSGEAGKHYAEIQHGKMILSIDKSVPNLKDTSFRLILNAL